MRMGVVPTFEPPANYLPQLGVQVTLLERGQSRANAHRQSNPHRPQAWSAAPLPRVQTRPMALGAPICNSAGHLPELCLPIYRLEPREYSTAPVGPDADEATSH
jgi:hypothetical protein